MIYTIGDSHSYIPYRNIPNVITKYLGALTMKRAGHPDEKILLDAIASLQISPSDSLIFATGEIDVRCWVHVHITQRKRELNELLHEWTSLYLDKILSIQTPAQKIIQGVTPPAPKEKIDREEYPVAGTNQDRILYTNTINSLLSSGAQKRNFLFLDISSYADSTGMINPSLCDGSVHIGDNTLLKKAMKQLSIL